MNAPAFLPATLSMLLVLIAAYALWRIAAAPMLGLSTSAEVDLLLLAAGIAGAGLVSSWAHTLPRAAWAALFGAAACYFAVRAGLARGSSADCSRAVAHTCGCLVLVYMFLAGVAPSSLRGSTAGQYTMAGMPGMYVDTTITYPALGLVCVAAMAFYAVSVLARPAPSTEASGRAEGGFAPGSVEACRVVVTLVLAYAILSKLV